MFPDGVSPYKLENGCFDQTTLYRKILVEIKKIESGVEMIALLKEALQIWLFPSLKCELCGWNFEQMPR